MLFCLLFAVGFGVNELVSDPWHMFRDILRSSVLVLDTCPVASYSDPDFFLFFSLSINPSQNVPE